MTEEPLWSDFNIAEELIQTLTELDLVKPLPIQVSSLQSAILEDKNVLGAARTGSGKTLAYAIPLINRILLNRDNPCSLLKRLICRKQQKESDFELIDGKLVAIEDMIVDKIRSAEEDNDSETDDSGMSDKPTENPNDFTCPEAIILVPTRELAVQVKEVIDELCKHTSINTCCLVGGLSQDKQIRVVKKSKPQIVIATPGRLYDLVNSDNVDHLSKQSIASIRTLVIDEADRMMQKGHYGEMIKLVDIIKEAKHFRSEIFNFRVYLFSATLVFIHELPDRFKSEPISDGQRKGKKPQNDACNNKKFKISQMLSILGIDRKDTSIIDLNDNSSHGRPSSSQLSEFKINCLEQEKDLYLYCFLMDHKGKRTIVFCNSKTCLRRLSNVMKYLGIPSLKLHADMDQKKRLSSLEKFKKRSDLVLIATDVAARGLDINNLDCVVHYQVPKISESYIHRSGRTARLNKSGVCLILCEPKEVTLYRKLCNSINSGKDMKDYDINISLRKFLKERVDLAQRCDKFDHHLRSAKSNRDWFTKAAKECDIDLDEDDMRRLSRRGKSQNQDKQDEAMEKKKFLAIRKKLDNLLKKSIPAKIY